MYFKVLNKIKTRLRLLIIKMVILFKNIVRSTNSVIDFHGYKNLKK